MAMNKLPFLKDSSKKIREDYPIIDPKVIDFVVKEFPVEGDNIKLALSNLRSVIENAIDSIEDKSAEIVKRNRDFDTSARYRDNSIRLHEISESIKQYVSWMEETASKDVEVSTHVESVISRNEEFVEPIQGEVKEHLVLSLDEDFTGKRILGFKLDEHEVEVTSWDDIVIYTAEVLTKNYKGSRGEKINEERPLDETISPENKVRNALWEIVNEYGIAAKRFKIYVNQ